MNYIINREKFGGLFISKNVVIYNYSEEQFDNENSK